MSKHTIEVSKHETYSFTHNLASCVGMGENKGYNRQRARGAIQMKLGDLTKHMSTMTADELREHIRLIRHTKYVAKPAKAKHVADAVKIEKRHRATKVDKIIGGMSDADKQQLLLLLEGGE